jgi:UDP-galactopyranose mutase
MYHDIDYLIIGSGLTGGTIARLLHDRGYKVLVVERRNHLGGNIYDYTHESGIRIHKYGPHYFRTSSEEIWKFVNRFAGFYKYIASVKSFVDGQYENWPIAASYIRSHIGEKWEPSFKGHPGNFEEAALAIMPAQVYEKFVKGYSYKQWGVDLRKISSELIKRFDVRHDDDERLMPKHKFQGLPEGGYSNFIDKLFAGIPVLLNTDYIKNKERFSFNKMLIYTGTIDEYFNFDAGKLKYRAQERKHIYLPNTRYHQPYVQVNNPSLNNGAHIRTIEWKYLMKDDELINTKGTVITKETTKTPENPNEYEYPFPNYENIELYKKYKARAEQVSGLLICGRLGDYKYYDMDQAIGRALLLVKSKLLKY